MSTQANCKSCKQLTLLIPKIGLYELCKKPSTLLEKENLNPIYRQMFSSHRNLRIGAICESGERLVNRETSFQDFMSNGGLHTIHTLLSILYEFFSNIFLTFQKILCFHPVNESRPDNTVYCISLFPSSHNYCH